MNKIGYLITAAASIGVFLLVSWFLDKTKIREKIETRSADKSGAWIDLRQRLDRIEGKLK